MRSPVSHVLPLAALLLAGGAAIAKPAPQRAATGPAADYPVVVGGPFTVGSQTYAPVDKLNYDEVGQASVGGAESGGRISAAHKTLPLPSYVEVTSLTSGRTILVRVERRGPMSNEILIELSPAAAGQLGLSPTERVAVRVRRTNPPEPERALLRAGERAPERMATPKGLLDALNRKLQQQAPVAIPAAPTRETPGRKAARAPAPPRPAPGATPSPAATHPPVAAPAPRPAPVSKPAAADALVVQIAAFSTRQRADAAAAKLGASVVPAGRLWRMRLGPFTARAEAEAALAKARAAGYSDARIQRAD